VQTVRLVIPLPGNEDFAARLAHATGAELGRLECRRFPDMESYVRLHADPAGRPVDLVCTLAQPDEGFLRLIFVADTVRELGATEVNLVAPYLAYMRQDRRFQSGESISSRSFARLVSGSFDRVLTVDPHLHRHPTLSAIYSAATTTLHAAPLLADWIGAAVQRPLLVGPDEESAQWVSAIAARIGAPHTVLRKTRHGDRQVAIEVPDMARWRDHQPVLVDDIASSGRTLVEAARQLTEQGLSRPQCVVVHGLFADDAFERLTACCAGVVSTDSVPHRSNGIALAPLFADAIARRLLD
jgi:ribose-phosphate pyrophosphokinase